MTIRNVVVLMGGPSAEHAVSLKSGGGVVEALTRRGMKAEAVIIPQGLTTEAADAFTRQTLAHAAPHAVFIALHGAFGEDGTAQAICESLGLPFTGSDAQASRLGMDKISSRRCFESAGLSVPSWMVLELPAIIAPSAERACPACGQTASAEAPDAAAHARERLERGRWSYPIVVKPASQGSSFGVSVIGQPECLPHAIGEAGRFEARVLIEVFVAGREVTAGVLGDEALPVVEIRPSQPFFDFKAKYTAGATTYVVPAPLPEDVTRRVQEAGLAAHRAIGCRHLSRTDIILGLDGVPVVLEINTIPGFTPTSLLPKAAACRGISYDALCERLVRMAREPRVRSAARPAKAAA